MKRFTVLILALVLSLSVFAACAGNEDTAGVTSSFPDSRPVTESEAITDAVTDLADELDDATLKALYDGQEFIVAGWNGFNFGCVLDYDEPEAGNILQEAAYARNEEIRQRFGVEVSALEDLWNWNATSEGIMKIIELCSLADNVSIDMILYDQFGHESLIIDNLVLDVAALPYVNLQKDYYNHKANQTYYLRDNLYVLYSDITYPLQSANTILVNKERLVDGGYDPAALYGKVNDGTWTLDVMLSMIEGRYVSVNGENAHTTSDIYGFSGSPMALAIFYPGAGLKGTYLTDEGFAFDYGTDFSLEVIDRLVAISDSEDIWIASWDNCNDIFFQGRSMFTTYASEMHYLKDLPFDFGVLPIAKYKEEQETYYNLNYCGVAMVPANVEDETFVGAMIEAMASASAKHTVPAFYDNFMEQGVFRDQASRDNWRRMIDEWGVYEFSKVFAADDRVRNYRAAFVAIETRDTGFKDTWDLQKDVIGQLCDEFYDWYLAE